jgi:hypothetical protein
MKSSLVDDRSLDWARTIANKDDVQLINTGTTAYQQSAIMGSDPVNTANDDGGLQPPMIVCSHATRRGVIPVKPSCRT